MNTKGHVTAYNMAGKPSETPTSGGVNPKVYK
jgi:hypothetical protein